MIFSLIDKQNIFMICYDGPRAESTKQSCSGQDAYRDADISR